MNTSLFAGNFHKWMYTARSCAFLWISPTHCNRIRPLVTSNHVQSVYKRFSYLGTRDISNFYTLPTALKFYEEVGGVVSSCLLFC